MRKIHEIAAEIRANWKKVSPFAEPYLSALEHLGEPLESFGLDSGQSVAAYFLGNAHGFRGPAAKALKAELKAAYGLK
jgi:hypothetical protein